MPGISCKPKITKLGQHLSQHRGGGGFDEMMVDGVDLCIAGEETYLVTSEATVCSAWDLDAEVRGGG